MLGIWKPLESKNKRKRDVHRVGLIWNGKAWEVHVIDDEIEKDRDVSRSFPMQWQYAFNEKGFPWKMKCGIESEFRDGSDLTFALGDKPFFDLKRKGFLTISLFALQRTMSITTGFALYTVPKMAASGYHGGRLAVR